jgi:catechol 2,3-dioxygenase-like lactoylglutathione lyase family enzyme
MTFDHVGYLVRDLDAGIAFVAKAFGRSVTRTVDRPQWGLLGAYLDEIEVFTFTDPALLDERIGAGVDAKLDHLAYRVDDIRAEMAALAGAGFSGPDLRGTVDEPFDLGGTLHVWTTANGLGLQLMQVA